MLLLGSMDVPAAGFSALAACTAVAVNVRRHWQAEQMFSGLDGRRPLSAGSNVRNLRNDTMAGLLVFSAVRIISGCSCIGAGTHLDTAIRGAQTDTIPTEATHMCTLPFCFRF